MATYSQGHDRAVLEAHGSRNAANSCAYFTPLLRTDYRLLDVGCGPGTISSSLARLLPQGRVVGLETSDEILQTARAQSDLPPNCSFAVGDAYKLPYNNNSFHVVHASQVLVHLADPVSAMKEMKRVCKPGGFIACREGDWDSSMTHPMNEGVMLWSQASKENIWLGGGQPNGGRMLMNWALGAGFEDDGVQYSHGNYCYAGEGRRWWGENMAARVSNDQKWRDRLIQHGLAKEWQLEKMRDGWLRFADQRDGINVVSCGQVVCYKT